MTSEVLPQLPHMMRAHDAEMINSPIGGIAILNKEAYVIYVGQSVLEVFHAITLCFSRCFHFVKLNELSDIVSSIAANCLYILNDDEIYVIDGNGNVLRKWSVDTGAVSLSVTPLANVLCICEDRSILREYTEVGDLLQEVKLQPGVYAFHAVRLRSGHFIISNEINQNHTVSVVDAAGSIMKAFDGKLRFPKHLLVDQERRGIFVADQKNSRVLYLDFKLQCSKEFLTARCGLTRPTRLCIDSANNRIFVVDNGDRNFRIMVFELPLVL